jgi:GT2 family glycosyltransferase/glycosyltransferase involved in cell wall biosynthesis
LARLAALAAFTRQAALRKTLAMTTVDVIVPVYRDAAAVRRCFASLLATRQETPLEIVVVNDASPDAELVRWLRELAQLRRVTLLDDTERQGLAATLNRGVALHAGVGRDVVILRSDTELAGDWLDRLARHARVDGIGTVVPFVNAGGVACYPRSGVANALPPEESVASLDRLFQRANAGIAVEIPLSYGPCVYVRRGCLNAVGAFRDAPAGTDAADEAEFSLRATEAGYRHVVAADVFIGCQAETEDAQQVTALAQAALDRKYPHYRAARADLAHRDPACPYQRRVDLLRLAQSPRQLLLFVSHAWGGGVRHHMNELSALISERCDVLMLEPVADDVVKLSWPRPGEGFAAYFSLPQETSALVSLLTELGLARIHFHHVHGLPQAVLDLPIAANVPYDCTLHDYYPICPQYHLVTEDGRYCGEPDAAGCAACISRRPNRWGMDIAAWRDAFHALLRSADRVFAPSHDVAQRIARYFPDVDTMVLPHVEGHPAAPRVVRVLTLGRLSPEKGLRVVTACAADARARALPLSFRVLGATSEPVPQWPDVALSIRGQYAEGELPALIAAERPDVIWFPAQIPESYSYTLSAAIAAGAAIVASALGALPERLAGNPRAVLLPADAKASEWNDALLKAGGLAQVARVQLPRVAAQ